MKKTLSEKEVDVIIGNALIPRDKPEPSDHRSIELCNFRNAGQMSERYARFTTNLFEAFARNSSNSLGAYLRSRFEMTLSAVEQMPVRDFWAAYRETGFVAVLSLQPGNTAVLLQVENSLVFPIIDVLLGGLGAPQSCPREMTEIDEDIMEGVAQIICRQLETTWQPLGVEIQMHRRQKATQEQDVFPANEKLTALTFEIKLNETSGALALTFPTSFASAMLRQISADPRKKPRLRAGQRTGLRERVLACTFDSTIGIRDLRIPLSDLVHLRPGSVLNLRCPVKNPASLILGDREFFEAVPVRSGKQRAAQLLRPIA
ncbi:MAG: FliM/FliN family flagellar motor switch protein [Candidatus Korobacteraceae bacterium]